MVTIHAEPMSYPKFNVKTFDGTEPNTRWEKQDGKMVAVKGDHPVSRIENPNSGDLSEATAFEGKDIDSLVIGNRQFCAYVLPGTKVQMKKGATATVGHPDANWQRPTEEETFFTNPALVLSRLKQALRGHHAVIGAGGKGTRALFGQPGLKPTLPVDSRGGSFLTTHIGQLATEHPDSITIVAPPGYGEQYSSHIHSVMGEKTPKNLSVTEQPDSSETGLTGSGYGILTGIARKKKPTVFVPVDAVQSKVNWGKFISAYKNPEGHQQYATVLGGMPVGDHQYQNLGVATVEPNGEISSFREKPSFLSAEQLKKAWVNTFAMLFDPRQARNAIKEVMARRAEEIKQAQRGAGPLVDLDYMKSVIPILQEQTGLPLGMVPHAKLWSDATSTPRNYLDARLAREPKSAENKIVPLVPMEPSEVRRNFISNVQGPPVMVTLQVKPN
ncbi:MAG: sugar phosphate nucleotidyltransferase [Vampirovibrionales bacterium]|nr:sugar phosphate nucleotidyltransferase [Vampirovibrionales bacterium]